MRVALDGEPAGTVAEVERQYAIEQLDARFPRWRERTYATTVVGRRSRGRSRDVPPPAATDLTTTISRSPPAAARAAVK